MMMPPFLTSEASSGFTITRSARGRTLTAIVGSLVWLFVVCFGCYGDAGAVHRTREGGCTALAKSVKDLKTDRGALLISFCRRPRLRIPRPPRRPRAFSKRRRALRGQWKPPDSGHPVQRLRRLAYKGLRWRSGTSIEARRKRS